MNTKFYLIALAVIFSLSSCKKDTTFTDYKYFDRPESIACENINIKLYNEALYSFEDDILNFFQRNDKKSLLSSYSQFIRLSVYNRADLKIIASEHSLKVFEALKNESDLWDVNNTKSHLNYNGPLMACISNNISDKNFKTTLNALLSTNSMSPKLFGTPLTTRYNLPLRDKYLASYIAFDLFYAKMFDVDFSDKDQKQKVDFNNTN